MRARTVLADRSRTRSPATTRRPGPGHTGALRPRSHARPTATAPGTHAGDPTRGRVNAVGRGEREPVAPNEIDGRDNPAGRAQNRRVEIEFDAVVPTTP